MLSFVRPACDKAVVSGIGYRRDVGLLYELAKGDAVSQRYVDRNFRFW